MTQRWYYTRRGWEVGPVSEEQLRALLSSGQIASAEQVWAEGWEGRLSPERALELHFSRVTARASGHDSDEPPPFPPSLGRKATPEPLSVRSPDEPPPIPPGLSKRPAPSPRTFAAPPVLPTAPAAARTGVEPTGGETSSSRMGGQAASTRQYQSENQRASVVKPLILATVIALGLVLAYVALKVVRFDSKIRFSVDGGIVNIGGVDYFYGDPQLRIGDPPTPKMEEQWDTDYYQNATAGDDQVGGRWRDDSGLDVYVSYHFTNDKLSRVELEFDPEQMLLVVRAVTAKFGPPHHVEHPVFTTTGSVMHQNEIVSWDTDAGRFELWKYKPDIKVWNKGGGRLVRPPTAEQSWTVAHDTQNTDAWLERLKGSTQLRRLSLKGTQITDAGLEHLKGQTRLRTLCLNETGITDAGLEHLKGLTELRLLNLNETGITDAGLEHLKGLTQLKELCLRHTKITDAGLKHLEGLTQLKELNLYDTKITDAGLEHLKGLTKLGSLFIGGTEATYQRAKSLLPDAIITH
jgi:hypothetical protein